MVIIRIVRLNNVKITLFLLFHNTVLLINQKKLKFNIIRKGSKLNRILNNANNNF